MYKKNGIDLVLFILFSFEAFSQTMPPTDDPPLPFSTDPPTDDPELSINNFITTILVVAIFWVFFYFKKSLNENNIK